ncbi:P-loop containing nucleoside triphosphate hydrolase protein [Coprinopsis marcescibilis]|uniref:P-loop containing nucleoside triphosphate hydrolase protein n=1 Tax=Coprinopsis marcescibilis TaxID=230819 RepID=A0A5C3KRB0_COPMA|nr:P-loop containing nucleoside triphosphate hydrolase protein [Coprinopsis marcescibilis]
MAARRDSFEFDHDEFVDVVFGRPPKKGPGHPPHKPDPKDLYQQSIETTSAPWAHPEIPAADTLRRLYPNHSLVMTRDFDMNILSLPGVAAEPVEQDPLITNVFFVPLNRRYSQVPGALVDKVELGVFNISWEGYEYIAYLITIPSVYGPIIQTFLLHEGDEDKSRLLLLTAGIWANELHNEIWVYNGYWAKDRSLYSDIQRADWKDVILKDTFKKSLQKDINGFFDSEKIYKDLGIPWKRGLIMYGPPGNGKTISIKAIMKTCIEKGYNPLYEAAMREVFALARKNAPCLVVLEDLDSLINDGNRSFFLNELDGLQGNDGLLLIGTTNHFDRLDPGLSSRPSRFDRKYLFDDPDLDERKLYVIYWQKKLEGNPDVDFPDKLVDDIAKLTDRFSFAYLKEAFVSTLVTLAGAEADKKQPFAELLKTEIEILRKELNKGGQYYQSGHASGGAPRRPPRPSSATERDLRVVLDALSDSAPFIDNGRQSGRIFDSESDSRSQLTEEEIRNKGDIRALLDALSAHLQVNDLPSFRRYETGHYRHSSHGQRHRGRDREERDDEDNGRSYRRLLDRISTDQRDRDLRLARLQENPLQRHYDTGGPSTFSGGYSRHSARVRMSGPDRQIDPTAADLA